jgi:hypothetical protein
MKPGDYAIYCIRVSNINPTENEPVARALERHGIPRSYQRCPSDMEINISRLPTFWRRDTEERDWQYGIEHALGAIKPPPDIAFEAAPWSSPPNYPQGDLSL